MNKKREFQRIAREAGIKSPEVQYERQQKAYSIRITVPLVNGSEVTKPPIGIYAGFAAARDRLPDDIRAFLKRHPEDKFMSTYHSVTKDDTPDKRAMTALLQRIIASKGQVAISEADRETAQAILEALPPEKAQGNYQSRHPDQPKQAIEWQQPQARQHPVYTFEVDCPYCEQHVTLERHSPREPQHCGEDACRQEHERSLARERKRRQRKRQ